MERTQTLNERQNEMLSTCMDSCKNAAYPLMALIEEVGELAEKVNSYLIWSESTDEDEKDAIELYFDELIQASKYFKMYAKGIRHGSIEPPFTIDKDDFEGINEISLEIGDVDWDLMVFAHNIGVDSQSIADLNHSKLMNRQRRNEIDGNGDHERTPVE